MSADVSRAKALSYRLKSLAEPINNGKDRNLAVET